MKRILVDADACPVKNEILRVAKTEALPVFFFVDVNHIIKDDYATTITVDQGADSVDLKLINSMNAGDIIITSDYGVATLALGKKGYVLHPNGYQIDATNIDKLLLERHLSRLARAQKQRGTKHKKRTPKDNQLFEKALIHLIRQCR